MFYRVGDEVVAHKSGYLPRKGKIVSFNTYRDTVTNIYPRFGLQTGIYEVQGSPNILFEGASEAVAYPDTHSLKLQSVGMTKQRGITFLKLGETFPERELAARPWKRVGDLPETPFNELDIVSLAKPFEGEINIRRVRSIDYDLETGDHRYTVEGVNPFTGKDLGNGYIVVSAHELKLISRGNIWRQINGQNPTFSTIIEEIEFALKTGQFSELHDNERYREWSFEEAISKIVAGEASFFMHTSNVFGMMYFDVALALYKLKDDKLHERARQFVIKRMGKS